MVLKIKEIVYDEPNVRIDWHDWHLMDEEELRVGIGEHGVGSFLRSYPLKSKEINDTHGYNGYLSDKIALNRSLKDLRPKQYVNIFRCSFIITKEEESVIKMHTNFPGV